MSHVSLTSPVIFIFYSFSSCHLFTFNNIMIQCVHFSEQTSSLKWQSKTLTYTNIHILILELNSPKTSLNFLKHNNVNIKYGKFLLPCLKKHEVQIWEKCTYKCKSWTHKIWAQKPKVSLYINFIYTILYIYV